MTAGASAPDDTTLALPQGRLEVPAGELERMVTFRAGGDGPAGRQTTARDELMRMTHACKHQTEMVEQLRARQLTAIRSHARDALGHLQHMVPQPTAAVRIFAHFSLQVAESHQAIEQQLAAVVELSGLVLLEPAELAQVRFLRNQNTVLAAHCTALRSELQWFSNNCPRDANGRVPNLNALVVRDQPDSEVVFKGKALSGAYTVTVVGGVGVEASVGAVARALLVCPDYPGGKMDKADVDQDEAPMEPFAKQALFQHVRPTTSTRMNLAHLEFECTVAVGEQYVCGGSEVEATDGLHVRHDAYHLQSLPTEPFIIITHESQWVEAASKLIVHDAFGADLARTISWQRFMNVVHLHYFRASRQELKSAVRKLNPMDMLYFFNRFFASSTVTHAKALEFLRWFAPAMAALRFKKQVQPMWLSGCICGFIDKERCNRALSLLPEGTFLIRFSESSPGQFAVAYVSDDPRERVKHYLVKPEG